LELVLEDPVEDEVLGVVEVVLHALFAAGEVEVVSKAFFVTADVCYGVFVEAWWGLVLLLVFEGVFD
jgi:hypothetical protein